MAITGFYAFYSYPIGKTFSSEDAKPEDLVSQKRVNVYQVIGTPPRFVAKVNMPDYKPFKKNNLTNILGISYTEYGKSEDELSYILLLNVLDFCKKASMKT